MPWQLPQSNIQRGQQKMNSNERKWRFSEETKEKMLSTTNPVELKLSRLIIDYADKFGDLISIPVGMNQDIEDWIADVQRCIDADTPYIYPENHVPKGCII